MVNFKDYIKKTKDSVGKKGTLSDKTKSTLLVAAIGGGTGLAIASVNNKNLAIYGLIGVTIAILSLNLVKYETD
jgi:hypothetical protein